MSEDQNQMTITEVKVLELTNSAAAEVILKENLGYDASYKRHYRSLPWSDQKSTRNTVDYLEVLKINYLRGMPRKETGFRTEIKEWMR